MRERDESEREPGDRPRRAGESSEGPATLWAVSGRYMGFGLTWALSTLLFLFVGHWIDGRLGTTPWLLITGAFVGGAAGFYSLYHHIVAAGEEQGEPPERSGDGPGRHSPE